MSCAHDGIIKEEILKRFVYPNDPDNGEWQIVSRTETCTYCGEQVTRESKRSAPPRSDRPNMGT